MKEGLLLINQFNRAKHGPADQRRWSMGPFLSRRLIDLPQVACCVASRSLRAVCVRVG